MQGSRTGYILMYRPGGEGDAGSLKLVAEMFEEIPGRSCFEWTRHWPGGHWLSADYCILSSSWGNFAVFAILFILAGTVVFDSTLSFRWMLLWDGYTVGTVVLRWSLFHSVQQILQTLYLFIYLEKEVCNICIKVKEAVRKASRQVCSFLFCFFFFPGTSLFQ